MTLTTRTGEVAEWDYLSHVHYADPFNDVRLDIIISNDKQTWKVPAFWRGKERWSVRFSAPEPGLYSVRSLCSDKENTSLHNIIHTLHIEPSETGTHKALTISSDKNILQYDNGDPFLWLGDTWWMGLSDRLHYPEEFHVLSQDRREKGFNVILLVAGLYPDMDAFDARAANQSGFVWEEGFTRINPAFFDEADARIFHLVSEGFIPCIVGAWGYYLLKMGKEKMCRHWEYLIARWGAYPVVWCAAGEAAMPYYLSETPEQDKAKQIKGWTEIVRFIRERDPFRRPVTIHPTEVGRDQITQPELLDFELLQAGHNGYKSIFWGAKLLHQAIQRTPKMPVVMGEINYEGIIHDTGAEMQRFAFWSSLLGGAVGFTYGANGIWQVNTPKIPFGSSPHGGCWGNTPWQEAMKLPGSRQIGLAKALLETLPWEQMQPRPDWITPSGSHAERETPYIAGIGELLRIVYFYGPVYPWSRRYTLLALEAHIAYEAYFWDPRTAQRYPLGMVTATAEGAWDIPPLPTFEDWVLVLQARFAEASAAPLPKRGRFTRMIPLFIRQLLKRLLHRS